MLYLGADSGALTAFDLATRAKVWSVDEMIPGVCTPVVWNNFLVYGSNDGGILCRDAKTGAELWLENTDEGFYASPILAGDRVYLLERSGLMHIFKPGAKIERLGAGKLGEPASATPAILGNTLICRGVKHLYRIGS
jgi:outer membrane protein assembly factor BamB